MYKQDFKPRASLISDWRARRTDYFDLFENRILIRGENFINSMKPVQTFVQDFLNNSTNTPINATGWYEEDGEMFEFGYKIREGVETARIETMLIRQKNKKKLRGKLFVMMIRIKKKNPAS